MATIYGNSSNNTLNGTASADKIYGYDGDDTLNGSGGNDYLDGGAGADTMTGGLGNDTYVIDNAADVIVESAGQGTDAANIYTTTVNLSSSSIEVITLYSGAVTVTANSENNTIRGNENNNVIDAGSGNDQVFGGVGDDTLTGGAGIDILYGEAGNDILNGGTEDDRLYGGAGTDTLNGGDGNDVLSGGTGADSMSGGLGNDQYYVDSLSDSITENASEGIDKVYAEISYTLGNNVENIVLLGASTINGAGNALNNIIIGNTANNTLTGNAGDDTLNGGEGADTMTGGTGNDTYYVDNASDSVTEAASSGTDRVISTIAYTLGTDVENLFLTGSANVNGTGNALNNTIKGNEGNNTLNGGVGNDTLDGQAGNDTLIGGLGNDQYYIDSLGDTILENLNEGNDRVYTYVNYVLATNLENLVMLGSSNLSGTGNSLSNNLRGNSGNNTLDGSTGADVMAGGGGDDAYIVENAGDVVTENASEGFDTIYAYVNYTLSANVERLVMLGTALTLQGNTGDNTLTGNSQNNTLVGDQGNDILDGGAGSDTLNGGDGNDTYYIDAGDTIVDSSGTDTVYSYISYTLASGLENLVLLGDASINGTGSTGNNTITGNVAANILTGSGGTDTLIGGDGDDTYVIDDATDVVTELVGEGTDSVQLNFSNYTLGANLENLSLQGSVANGSGNGLDNTIDGNASANIINGGSGNDRINGAGGNDTLNGDDGDDIIDGGAGTDAMTGGLGNDTFFVDASTDTVVEAGGGGTDTVSSSVSYTLGANIEALTLTGSSAINGTGNAGVFNEVITGNSGVNTLNGNDGDDTLYGGASNDTLNGGNGNDILDGNSGDDVMVGGAGNDSYYVDSAADSITEASGTDIIYAAVSYTISSGVENMTLIGTGAISGTGNSGNNTITGNASGNRLSGGGGTDTLIGGNGNDTYVYSGAFSGTITETASGGSDTIEANFSVNLGTSSYTNVENIVFTTGGLTGTGTSADNSFTSNGNESTFYGNAGNDYFNSLYGGGNGIDYPASSNDGDTLYGGLGDDTYLVGTWDEWDRVYIPFTDVYSTHFAPAILDTITEYANEGTDTVIIVWTDIDDDDPWGGDGGDGIETTNVYLTTGSNDPANGVFYVGNGNLENVTFQGTDKNKNAHGNGLANRLIGGTSNNTLNGNGGNDTLVGGGGGDTMNGGDGDDAIYTDGGDTITGGNGTDTIYSTVSINITSITDVENITLQSSTTPNVDATGNTANNVLIGNEGNNSLNGMTGSDTMSGGKGNDTYTVDNSGDVCNENESAGTDQVNSSVTWTLGTHFENLYLSGSGAINGTGNALNNSLNAWDNTAKNTLTGGAGDDVYYINHTGGADNTNADVVVENADEGYDTVYLIASASVTTYTAVSNVEQVYLYNSGTTITNLTGNTLNNGLWSSKNTTINTLRGLTGDDFYVIGGNDVVLENSGEGYDVVYYDDAATTAAIALNYVEAVYAYNFTAGRNLNISLNTVGITVVGSGFGETITTGSGNDVLWGNGGADTLVGGGGDDIYQIGAASTITESAGAGTDWVISTVSYTLAANVDNLTLDNAGGAINGTGNGDANTITGNASANTLSGAAGNDILDGGGGADSMTGGQGNDTYYVDNALDVVTENVSEGTADLVYSLVNYTISDADVENLSLYGTGNVNATGNASVNALVGNSGNNKLDGLGGADTMTGGAGDDIYVVDVAGDTVVEALNEGTDEVQTTVSYTLSANVEYITLQAAGGAINGTGNALANILTGNASANVLTGGAGDDIYYVDSTDSIVESVGGGTDTALAAFSFTIAAGFELENIILTGSSNINATGNEFNNFLQGNSGDNILTGNAGNDTLDGMAGNDTMAGGLGDDVYFVDNTLDALTENLSEGEDTVYSQATTFTLGANVENLTLVGLNNISGTGNTLNNVIYGNAGNNVLTDGGGNDTFAGLQGNDTITGGSGNTTYEYARGDGADLVTDTGGSDALNFDTSVSHTQLWFSQSGSNLLISVVGTSDSITVVNWFSGVANHVETISAGDGFTLDESRVQTLVSAMAALTPPPMGYTDLQPENYDALELTFFSTWQG